MKCLHKKTRDIIERVPPWDTTFAKCKYWIMKAEMFTADVTHKDDEEQCCSWGRRVCGWLYLCSAACVQCVALCWLKPTWGNTCPDLIGCDVLRHANCLIVGYNLNASNGTHVHATHVLSDKYLFSHVHMFETAVYCPTVNAFIWREREWENKR